MAMVRLWKIVFVFCASALSLWCVDALAVSEKAYFESVPQPESIKLLFLGDVMVHTPQLTKAESSIGYDFKPCFRYVKPIISSVDYAVANLETTLTDIPPYTGYPRFRSPSQMADALADAGVDMVTTANNHTLDNDAEGVLSTIAISHRAGLEVIGTSRPNPLRVNIKGFDIAFLTYTHSTNGIPIPEGVDVPMLDTVRMARDLELCRDAECRVAFLHWGAEYVTRPSRNQREIADFLHRSGCEVVIGSHPHAVQRAECSKSRVTVYSLGNFISNQSTRYSDGGVMAEVTIVRGNDGCEFALNIVPVWVDRRDYAVIPRVVGDTLGLGADYELFMSDCERIVKNVR